VGAAGAALLAAGCGADRKAEAAAEPKTVLDHFTIAVGGHPASLQVAVLPAEQERGLMQRADLGRDEGMIFVNARPGRLAFWMKNTPEALDIGYLDPEGVVAEIYLLLPYDQKSVESHGDQLQFALEMPRGWFAAHGVHAGTRLDLQALGAALRARGFDPPKFGLP
jgi:uncharacterized membrane protein (UPF0127 family)